MDCIEKVEDPNSTSTYRKVRVTNAKTKSWKKKVSEFKGKKEMAVE